LPLIDVVEDVYQHLDSNESGIGIYLDLKKAFHTVNHKILLDKKIEVNLVTIECNRKSYMLRRLAQ